MKRLITIMTLISSLTASAQADDRQQMALQLEQNIINLTQNLVHQFDPKAMVITNVSFQTTTRRLPLLPFSVRELKLDALGRPQIKSINIAITGNKTLLNPNVQTKIKRYLQKQLGVNPRINFTHEQQPLFYNFKDRLIAELNAANILTLIKFAIVLAVTGFFLIFAFWHLFSQSKTTRLIIQGLNAVAESIAFAQNNKPIIDIEAQNNVPKLDAARESSLQAVFDQLPDHGLAALLTDCYWSYEDAYGAYIWRRLSVSRRQMILEQLPTLESWVSYLLKSAREEYLGYEQDPYYLNPLPIIHVDNQDLTEFLRKNPTLYASLPELRKNHLDLNIEERLNLSQIAVEHGFSDLEALKSLPASNPRTFKLESALKVSSIDEEKTLMNLPEISFEQKKSILSLIWLKDLTDQQIQSLFEQYNAQTIASLLIAPEEIIEKMLINIPEKKRKLVESYRKTIAASRDNPIYVQVCQEILRLLEESTIISQQERPDEHNQLNEKTTETSAA